MPRTVNIALKSHLSQPYQTICTCWKVVLQSGAILGFTDHDQPVTILGVNCTPLVGYTRSDAQHSDDLSVDNIETEGILNSPNITETSLRAGVWDYATVDIFYVNWADTTQGVLYIRSGHLGEVSIDKNFSFKAELRGMAQAYSYVLGELTSPSCRAKLYDARCGVNPAAYTFTGTVAGVFAGGMVIYDPGRTEAGPTGGLSITSITNANPGKVTFNDPAGNLYNGQYVTISGVVGMANVNTSTVVRNYSAGPPLGQFDLPVDTTSYGAYTSGGTITPLGAGSGYFENGVITFTSGLNNGISLEVRAYVPGQIELFLQPPYAVAIGDTYSIKAGCDKAVSTCITKFNNVKNFRGEPYLPGIDKMLQVGKQP